IACSQSRPKREWRPLEDRSCTDLPWFLLFTAFCVGMGGICSFTVATGGAARLLFGYDSFGNTCGDRNERLEGVKLSGLDHTDRRFVFFLDPCDIDLVQRRIRSMALCVSQCPGRELRTYEDLQSFAMNNGSELCSYELPAHNYPSLPERFDRCPKLPVPRSKPLPLLRRCSPVQVSCYARLAVAVVTFVGDDSVLHRLIAGVSASRDVIIGLCFLALVLSMLLMLIIRYISTVLVWVLTGLVVLGGTGVLWWLYIDHRLHGNDTTTAVRPRGDGNRGNGDTKDAVTKNQALLVYAAAATVFTVSHTPSRCFQLFRRTGSGLVEFSARGTSILPWFHAWGWCGISEFNLGRVQMTRRAGETELLRNGPHFIHTHIIHAAVSACALHHVSLTSPPLSSLSLSLSFPPPFLQNAYAATAINSTSFCVSARDAFVILVENALRVATINAVGDFVLFLGKVLIVSCTAFAGVLVLNYQRDLSEWLLPWCASWWMCCSCALPSTPSTNDGTPGKEFYMDKALMVRHAVIALVTLWFLHGHSFLYGTF
uniref:Choline transporter-like protein n=1 Tax=Neogobius melanostomus TaxID=47308 RepID=A0A8C6T940_9GOBI